MNASEAQQIIEREQLTAAVWFDEPLRADSIVVRGDDATGWQLFYTSERGGAIDSSVRSYPSEAALLADFVRRLRRQKIDAQIERELAASAERPDGELRTITFIPNAGSCVVSDRVLTGQGRARWFIREQPMADGDSGWRILASGDTSDYLADPAHLAVTDYNRVCMIEPALIGVWRFPVGSDVQLVDDELGLRLVDTRTGEEVERDRLFVPPTLDAGTEA